MGRISTGFIGLGVMGAPMAVRIGRAGQPVRLYDTAQDRLDAVAAATGGAIATGAADAASGTQMVITMLPTGADVAHVVLGQGGIADGFAGSGILIDMSSSEPSGSLSLAAELAERGIAMIDAPVSGGRAGALDGTLTIMAGGEAEVVERCRPVLETMGTRVVHTGAIGTGHALKSLNNTISAAGLLIAAEAFLVGARFGLEPDVMADVVNTSTGMNHATLNKMEKFVFSRAFDSGFSMDLMLKDLENALDLARDTATATPLAALSREIWAQARNNLEPGRDHTELVRWLERIAGAELERSS